MMVMGPALSLMGILVRASPPRSPSSVPSSDGWPPGESATGTVRYSTLGALFAPSPPSSGGGLSPTTATVSKHPGNPLFGQDKLWEPRLDNGYPNVVFDSESAALGDGPWRLWYGGIAPGGQYLYYANSSDGLLWHKPELNRYDLTEKWGKSGKYPWAAKVGKKNNIIMFGGGLGIYRDLHEPDPALRYKISGGSPAGCYSDDGSKDCVVGTAGSPDGIHNWSDVKSLGFPRPWRPDCHTNLFFDEPTSQYLMTTRDYVNPAGREISIAHSGGGGGGNDGGGKHWLGNWSLYSSNEYPPSTAAGKMAKVKAVGGHSMVDACGLHCRATAGCAFFFVYTSGHSAGSCFPKATAGGNLQSPACKPPKCTSAFYKMDGEPVSPTPTPSKPHNGSQFGNWGRPKIVEAGVGAHQLYSQITWRFYDILLGIVMVFDAENGNKGPNAGHVHCMLSYSRDNASTWQWVDPQGLAGLKEFIPAGPLGSFESHVCFAAHSPLRMPDGSTRLYYMGGNGPHSGARNSSFGLATLGPDRFAGLTGTGNATSKQVTATGHALILTLDVPSSGAVTVTLASGGKTTRSKPLTASGTDVPVQFSSAPFEPGQQVQVTLEISGATVFTMGFK